MFPIRRLLWVVNIGLLLLLVFAIYAEQTHAPALAQDNDDAFEYVPFPEGILIDDKTIIDDWRMEGNIEAIRAHGWDIWAGLTASSGQTFDGVELPIFDTWFSGTDVYEIGPSAAAFAGLRDTPHHLEPARQQDDTSAGIEPANQPNAVISFIKMNLPGADHIWLNDYWQASALDNLLQSCSADEEPQRCSIQPFPFDALTLKPTMWPIAQDGVSLIPVWEGVFPGETTSWLGESNAALPSDTWMQCVAVDMTGEHQPGDMIDATCNGFAVQAEVVSIDEFFSVPLNEAEFNALGTAGQPFAQSILLADGTSRPVAEGDSLVLVAMHVTGREIDQWTWQTYWWSPEPDDPTPVIWPPQYDSTEQVIEDGEMYVNYPGSGVDRPDSIPPPFDNYVMCTNYSFVFPAQPLVGGTNVDTKPEICFNPYLEANFTREDFSFGAFSNGGGINTNCMACHGNATWGGLKLEVPTIELNSFGYTAAEYVSRNDEQFLTNDNGDFPKVFLQLDFAWNITRAAEKVQNATSQ